MHITRWGEYGILCSLYLAREQNIGKSVHAQSICDEHGIPLQYAQQILHRLKKGGIIKSVRGPHGGYLLSRPAAEITLKDILNAAEGSTFEVVCDVNPIKEHLCSSSDHVCSLKNVWRELKVIIDSALEKKSLADLLIDNKIQSTNIDKDLVRINS